MAAVEAFGTKRPDAMTPPIAAAHEVIVPSAFAPKRMHALLIAWELAWRCETLSAYLTYGASER